MKLILTLVLQLIFFHPVFAESITASGRAVTFSGAGNTWIGSGLPVSVNFTGGQEVSSLLIISGFDLTALPPNATVRGIELEVERSAVNDVKDLRVALLKESKMLPDNNAASGYWPLNTGIQRYGGVDDLWGSTLIPSRDIRQGLAVAIAVQAGEMASASVSAVSVTIHYVVLAPIILTSFELTKTPDNHVKISWSTATEEDVKLLYVERSGDGVSFSPIFTITPVDQRNKYTSYSVIDEAPLNGWNYYRLKELDRDGQVFYFDTKHILVKRSGSGIQAYYTGSDIRLNFTDRKGEHRVVIYDSGGNLVRKASFPVSGSTYQASMPAPYRPGIYIIRVDGEGWSETARIFVGR